MRLTTPAPDLHVDGRKACGYIAKYSRALASSPSLCLYPRSAEQFKTERLRSRLRGFLPLVLMLTEGIPVHIVAARVGDDPKTVLDTYERLLARSDELAAERVARLLAG